MEELSVKCNVCRDLEDYGLVIPLEKLKENVADCDGCALLNNVVKDHESIDLVEKLETLVDSSFYVFLRDKRENSLGAFELYTHKGQPTKWKKIGPGREVSVDSSSDQCISLARRWLDTCRKTHDLCRRPADSPLPTRVIDVGSSPGDTPRLFITEGGIGDYVALSHCWGGSKPLVTKGATLEAHMERLDFTASSKTFQDAVNVTRRLGIRHLWIDSLCIIQDSTEDWAQEAGKMSEVYNNATMTLSADSAADSSYGLFPREEDRKALQATRHIPAKSPNGTEGNVVYVRKHSKDPFRTGSCAHGQSEALEPRLKSRGWVLQEELLSPRILHFRKEELSWICSACTRCECRIRPGLPIPRTFRPAMKPAKPLEPSYDAFHLYGEWPATVMDYTRRNLSVTSDRLAALSGLAGWMERATGDDYFVGLWGFDLAFEFLWYSAYDPKQEEAAPTPTRLPHPYAPTWSWASITGPVGYYGRMGDGTVGSVEPLLEVLDLRTAPVGPNRFGPVRMGPLQIAARVLPVRWEVATRRFIPEVDLVSDLDPEFLRVSLDVPDEGPPDDQEAADELQYALVLAGRWRSPEGITVVADQAVCLLVRQLSTEEDHQRVFESVLLSAKLMSMADTFYRVGLVRSAGSIDAWTTNVRELEIHVL